MVHVLSVTPRNDQDEQSPGDVDVADVGSVMAKEQQQVDSEEHEEQRRLTRAGARRLAEMRRTVHGSESAMRCEGETNSNSTGG